MFLGRHLLRLFLAAFVLTLAVVVPPVRAQDSQITPYMSGKFPAPLSRYCVLMDARSGKVLYARNAYAHREPASTTKMMAATILLEQGKLSDIVTAPPGIDKVPPSSLHLAPGEKINLEDLLYAMMLRSANDTPVAGAYYLSKGVAPFVALMNAKAQEIGCKNTHFVTPNGLYDPGHYSCAYDLATIARYAMTNLPVFREIVKTQRRKINRSVHKRDNIVENTATTFLKDFPGADGVKTGYISQAGHCFVGSATRGGWELIAVALNSPKCRSDVVQMLSYGYAQFAPVLAFPKGTPAGAVTPDASRPSIPVVTGNDLWDVAPKSEAADRAGKYAMRVAPISLPPNAAIAAGQKVGIVTLLYQDKPVMQTDVLAVSAVPARVSPIKNLTSSAKNMRLVGEIAAGIVALVALAVIGRLTGIILNARQAAKNSRERRSRITPDL